MKRLITAIIIALVALVTTAQAATFKPTVEQFDSISQEPVADLWFAKPLCLSDWNIPTWSREDFNRDFQWEWDRHHRVFWHHGDKPTCPQPTTVPETGSTAAGLLLGAGTLLGLKRRQT